MKHKRVRLLITIFVLVILVVFGLALPLLLHFTSDNMQWRFFTSIEDFSTIESYVKTNLDPQNDPNLGDLSVLESYTKIIEFDGKDYILYAYVFHDTAASIEYFHEVTGKETSKEWNFSSSHPYILTAVSLCTKYRYIPQATPAMPSLYRSKRNVCPQSNIL